MYICIYICIYVYIYVYMYICRAQCAKSTALYVQPIADGVAQNLEIISKKSQFSTRRIRILIGFIISTSLLHGANHKSM